MAGAARRETHKAVADDLRARALAVYGEARLSDPVFAAALTAAETALARVDTEPAPPLEIEAVAGD